jgi:phosphotransferase family enzyme
MPGLPDSCPSGLHAALERRGAAVGDWWCVGRRTYGHASGADGELLFWRFSTVDGDASVIEHELAVRGLVGTEPPLRTPAALAFGPDWLLERQAPDEGLAGPAAIRAVVDAAEALAGVALPALPGQITGLSTFGTVRHRARSLRRIGRDFAMARWLFSRSRLPLVTSHGDFHRGNLRIDGGVPWVLDWELVGRRPAGYDLLLLWTTLDDPADRETLLDATVELVGPSWREDVMRLRYVLIVRTLVSKVVPTEDVEPDLVAGGALEALLPEARAAAGLR